MRLTLLLPFGLAALLSACGQTRAVKPAPAAAPMVTAICGDFSFPVYFSGGAELDPQAKAVIEETAGKVRGCRIEKVEVLGLADASGRARDNQALSRRRAEAVAAGLVAAGLPRPAFTLEAAGQAGAVTSQGEPEPLRRRAEVVIRSRPPP